MSHIKFSFENDKEKIKVLSLQWRNYFRVSKIKIVNCSFKESCLCPATNLGSSAELLIKGRWAHRGVAGGVRMPCTLRGSRTSRVVWLGYWCRSLVLCGRRDHCFCWRALLRRGLFIQICWSLQLK